MNQDEIKELIESLKETDLEEVLVESGESQVFLRRSEVPVLKQAPSAAAGSGSAPEDAVKEKKLIPIKSTMVGTYYHADSPDRPPFIIVGNHVVPGQKVGIIEAMKIMKEMTSNVKGRIVKVLIDNGHPVEYGQELFLVDTEESR